MGNALTVGDSVVGGIPTSAKEVSFNNENCHIIDTNNTQEAIKQLDVANYATNQNLSNKVNKNWTRIIQCNSADNNFNVPDLTNYSEIMFTLQNSDGRTTGSSICPMEQFLGGALYATGIDGLQSTNTHYGVAVWLSNTHIEVAGTYVTARVFVR